ncbi:MAG: AsmA-like C-terminal region-containing protein, partial [Candidatus Binatia bacterium]
NEKGDFNILALAGSEKKEKGTRKVGKSKGQSPLSFLVSRIRFNQGKVHYVDRSSKQPVEIRFQNLDLDLSRVGLKGTAGIRLAANLFDGKEQNLTLEGSIGPLKSVKEWTQFPLDLQIGLEPLPFAQLTRAVPFLKEKVPSYLDINGPLMLKARVLGTIDRPRITGLTLAGAFFGSPSNNVNVTADLNFADGEFSKITAIKGDLRIEPVSLDRLKKIPYVDGVLPTALTSQGPLGLKSEIEGTLQDLKVHTLINADKSEIAYGKWLKKPPGTPAQIEVTTIKKKDGILLEKSTLWFHNLKLEFSGLIKEKPERLLKLRVRADSVDLSGWDRLLVPASSYDIGGKLGLDLSINKVFSPQGDNWGVQGHLNLDEMRVKDKKNGRSVEKITSQITFHGKEAQVKDLQLRLGSSPLSFQGVLRNPTEPTIRYLLRSPKLNLMDVTNLPQHKSDWIKKLTSVGEFNLKNGDPSIRSHLSLGEGSLQGMSYKDLKGDITWRPDRLGIRSLTFQALGGSLRGSGAWERKDGKKSRLIFNPTIRRMDLKALLSHLSPEFSGRVEGSVNLEAKLSGQGEDWASIKRTVQGKGKAEVQDGALKDFNLVKGVLSGITGLPGVEKLTSSRLSPRYATIFNRRDTPFDTLEASFGIGGERISTEDLLLATPDYKIQGEGRVGFDKAMRWNAMLALSPELTQELMEKHKNVRYMVNGKGVLGVSFKLDGKLPDVKPKPDIKQLAGQIQRGMLEKGLDRAFKGKESQKKNAPKEWIIKGLEQLLGK